MASLSASKAVVAEPNLPEEEGVDEGVTSMFGGGDMSGGLPLFRGLFESLAAEVEGRGAEDGAGTARRDLGFRPLFFGNELRDPSLPSLSLLLRSLSLLLANDKSKDVPETSWLSSLEGFFIQRSSGAAESSEWLLVLLEPSNLVLSQFELCSLDVFVWEEEGTTGLPAMT